MTTKKEQTKRRYDGAYPAVAEHMKTAKEPRDALAGFLEQIEQLENESQKAREANARLPDEIDALLRSGKMDEGTVEQLARKRAHLDLVPGRLNSLSEQMHEFKTSKEVGHATTSVTNAIHEAGELYNKKQIETALVDYMGLGVNEEIALEQVNLRPDIFSNALEFTNYSSFSAGSLSANIRKLLAAFDCLAAGFFPKCAEAAKIQKKWNVNLYYS